MKDKNMTAFKQGEFSIDCGPQFQGITDGSLWNGWECPWFTMDTMKSIQQWVNDGINDPIEIDGDKVFDVYINERIEMARSVIDGVTYYSIDGWCWDQE